MTCRHVCTVHVPNRQADIFADHGVAQIERRDQTVFALLVLLVVGLGHTWECRANDLPDPILDVFPESHAPIVIKDNPSGQYFMTTDPYAECEREPFQNPFNPGDSAYQKYEGRTVYRPYTRKTDWIELLGFLMPKTEAETGPLPSVPLSYVPGIVEVFRSGEKAEANAIMVRK